MEVYYAIPTKEPAKARTCASMWHAMGYKVAFLMDHDADVAVGADLVITGKYVGYPAALRTLCLALHDIEVVVTGGDDILPDPRKMADEIAKEFLEYFPTTFGVMQPTGDRWILDKDGRAASERICGSPWMGREFRRRINGGTGPFWHEYFHFYCDEEMHDVCERLGVLWQRPDLTHYHDHWLRQQARKRHEYLLKAKADEMRAKALFNTRKAANFPGHEPLP